MIKQNYKPIPKPITIISGVILNYFKYSQMVPMIVCWTLFLALFHITIIFFIGAAMPQLIPNFINYLIQTFNIQELHINKNLGTSDFLWVYGIISLIFYLIATLLKYTLKIQFNFSFKQKITYLLISISSIAILMVIFTSVAFFISNDKNYLGYYWIILFFSIGTIATSLYYVLISFIFSSIIKFLNSISS